MCRAPAMNVMPVDATSYLIGPVVFGTLTFTNRVRVWPKPLVRSIPKRMTIAAERSNFASTKQERLLRSPTPRPAVRRPFQPERREKVGSADGGVPPCLAGLVSQPLTDR